MTAYVLFDFSESGDGHDWDELETVADAEERAKDWTCPVVVCVPAAELAEARQVIRKCFDAMESLPLGGNVITTKHVETLASAESHAAAVLAKHA